MNRFTLAAVLVTALSICSSTVTWFEIRNWLWVFPWLIWFYRIQVWPFLGAVATIWYWKRHDPRARRR